MTLAALAACFCSLAPALANSAATATSAQFRHERALAEMRTRADQVADLYFDLAEARARGAPHDEITALEKSFSSRFVDAIASQGDPIQRLTGLEDQILCPWYNRNLASGNMVGTALILGALYAVLNSLDHTGYLPGVISPDTISHYVPAAIAIAASGMFGLDGALLYETRYARHLLLSAFFDQLRKREVPVPHEWMRLPTMLRVGGISMFSREDAVYYITRFTGTRGALLMSLLYQEQYFPNDYEVNRYIARYEEALIKARHGASDAERGVLEPLERKLAEVRTVVEEVYKRRARASPVVKERLVTRILAVTNDINQSMAVIPALADAWNQAEPRVPKAYTQHRIIRTNAVPHVVRGALKKDVLVASDAMDRLILQRGQLASADVLAALARLLPPQSTAPSQATDGSESALGYRTPAPPQNQSENRDLTLENFAGFVEVILEDLTTRLSPSAYRPGLYKMRVALKIFFVQGDPIRIPITIDFNSKYSTNDVINKESSWRAPLKEGLISAINTLADTKILADTSDLVADSDKCTGALTPLPQVRVETESHETETPVDGSVDEDAEPESTTSSTERREAR